MTNARDTHWKWNLSRGYVLLVITEIIKLLLEPDTQTANSIFFYFLFNTNDSYQPSRITISSCCRNAFCSGAESNEWTATESRTWGRGEELFGGVSHILAIAKETSCFLWEDSRAASFVHPHYQHYFTRKQTKENFQQLLTCYINSYILHNYHWWVKIKYPCNCRGMLFLWVI